MSRSEANARAAAAGRQAGGPEPLRVLLLEDNPADAELVAHQLRASGFAPVIDRVDTREAYVASLETDLDVILADYHLPQFDAHLALKLLQEAGRDVPFIIVSGSIGEETAVSIMKEGASDYLLKDRMARLGQAVRHALDQRTLRDNGRQAELALRRSEERYRELFENANDAIYIRGLDGRFSSVNRAAERISGYRRQELLGTDVADLLPPEHRELLREKTIEVLSSGTASFEVEWVRKDGSRVPLDVSARLIHEAGRPVGVQAIARDVTERKQAEREIAFLAYHDKLTGLPGRPLFEEFLEMALARSGRHRTNVAVLHLDIDDLKMVNDGLGHAAGDELLRQVAGRLRDAGRETDVIARLGGDEFLILLADLDADVAPSDPGRGPGSPVLVAASVANRIRESLAAPFRLAGKEVYISASMGISAFPQDAADAATLLKHANAAMLQSKRAGPGGYILFSEKGVPGGYILFSEKGVHPLAKLPFATRLRRAVERERWVLRYQPVVELSSGRMVGVEALIRWRPSGGKLVPPGDFIPLAEELGLMESIGDWVLREVARQCRAWSDQGLDLEISFNLSPRQLWQPDLAAKVLACLDEHGVDPHRVVAEITESTVSIDLERTQEILWSLHQRGIRLAIDDFGTGSSSLSRLKDLPIDILKIDRSFVRELPHANGAGSMVAAIIQLAHGLGMDPLAEGIETLEQWRFLAERGCPLGQGFHFSRPVTPREIQARDLRERSHPTGLGGQVMRSM